MIYKQGVDCYKLWLDHRDTLSTRQPQTAHEPGQALCHFAGCNTHLLQ